MADNNTLYVIPFSHFCNAGRWALQASGIPFREVHALPGLHRLPFIFPAKDSSGDRVTPYLRKSDGEFVRSSWDILEWAGRGAVPAEVKGLLDGVVGPAVRSIFYSHVLDHPYFDKQVAQSSWAQQAIWSVAGGKIKGVLKGLMVKDDEYIAGEMEKLATGWANLTEMLQREGEGNPFRILDDGKPNSSCIALCAIAGALLGPENQFGGAVESIPLEYWPEGLASLREQYRATPLGEFILSTYKETRMLSVHGLTKL
uniref:GST N-terminal domain-containing protein n=1 Tax=Tetraselmis chuii TaxID=63592 RepID=A0A7S1SGN4_9CHLO|mmetsp:Transcript_10553/g.19121  ORF Transcript_10553/g.19121 Transcript_10553/m.19121 type:complete len:257 (+) Transcript_10553:308-1078(+)|eukprot:CAMPEP_0177762144 /NCGR_PEP_ID=MMETSP0491_2-20121128/6184_1 /TAXON_ID=63592 /ORGANISM="Tetraselmis chuii, Strain PLY429" /LENGTH=256 /DNA_ID=CAMNT_0019278171 /DNA_START=242 /DNA_END=1012 /DNA_ORIENTATION=+